MRQWLILLTYGDNDHVANADYIRKEFNVPIVLHPGDLSLVENPTLETMMGSFQYRSVLFQLVFRLMKKKTNKITQKALEDFERFKLDILLSDKMGLKDYGLDGIVIYIPGHTAGSTGLLLSDGSSIAGDTFVNSRKPAVAPNTEDFEKLYASIKSLQTVYPGHGFQFVFSDYR